MGNALLLAFIAHKSDCLLTFTCDAQVLSGLL